VQEPEHVTVRAALMPAAPKEKKNPITTNCFSRSERGSMRRWKERCLSAIGAADRAACAMARGGVHSSSAWLRTFLVGTNDFASLDT